MSKLSWILNIVEIVNIVRIVKQIDIVNCAKLWCIQRYVATKSNYAFIHEPFLLGSFLFSLSLYFSLCVSLSVYLSWILLTHCQDHILTENIWFVWSRTSYSGDKWRCHRCGTDVRTDKRTREDRATQPMDAGWLSFAKSIQIFWAQTFSTQSFKLWVKPDLCVF